MAKILSVERKKGPGYGWLSCLMVQTKQGQRPKVFFEIDELQGQLAYSEAGRTGWGGKLRINVLNTI